MAETKINRYRARELATWAWRGYIAPEWLILLAAFIFMSAEGAMLGVLSYMLKPMFDNIFVAGDAGAVWTVGLIVLAVFAFRGVASVTQRTLLSLTTERAGARLQTDLLRHVMTFDGAFFQRHSPGHLIERIQGDVGGIKSAAGSMITGLGRDVIALLSLIAVTFSVDPTWTLIALIGVPLMILPSTLIQGYTRRRAMIAREVAGQVTTRFDEVFHGISAIKLNRLEDYQTKRFETVRNRRVKAEVESAFGQSLIPGLVDVMTGFGFLAVLYFGGRDIIDGEKTVGDFMTFFTAMALMFEPIRRLGSLGGQWQVAAASLERLKTLADTKPGVRSPAKPKPLGPTTRIVFDDVNLSYGGQPALRGACFTAEAGQTTALVGASGAGKSTVFNALTRLVDPDSGRITLGGVELQDLRLSDLRSQFSVVTQDATLFDETLRDNILLGRDGVPDADLARAVDAAHVSEFLPKIEAGLDTPAGPRGSSLSGGQRQRVAIARALLKDAPILLLDEATSALDAASEVAVQTALEALSADRTTLVIAHRLSTIRNADKIVVMDRGAVVDEGGHAELIKRGGIYANLHQLQFRDEAAE